MNPSVDLRSTLGPVGPGRFTTVSIQTAAGEIEAKLSDAGNWELRIRREEETRTRASR